MYKGIIDLCMEDIESNNVIAPTPENTMSNPEAVG